jgi:hypothetical protein
MATTVVLTRSPVALAGAATFVLIESAKEIVRAMNRIQDNYGKLTATGSLAGSSTYQMSSKRAKRLGKSKWGPATKEQMKRDPNESKQQKDYGDELDKKRPDWSEPQVHQDMQDNFKDFDDTTSAE